MVSAERMQFARGVLARQATLRYFKLWCRLCAIRPKEAAIILRMLAECDKGSS